MNLVQAAQKFEDLEKRLAELAAFDPTKVQSLETRVASLETQVVSLQAQIAAIQGTK